MYYLLLDYYSQLAKQSLRLFRYNGLLFVHTIKEQDIVNINVVNNTTNNIVIANILFGCLQCSCERINCSILFLFIILFV